MGRNKMESTDKDRTPNLIPENGPLDAMAWRDALARLHRVPLWNPATVEPDDPAASELRIQAVTAFLFLVLTALAMPTFLLGYGGNLAGTAISVVSFVGYAVAYALTLRGKRTAGAVLLLATVFLSAWASVLRLLEAPVHQVLVMITLFPLVVAAALGRSGVLWALAAANVTILLGLMVGRTEALLAYALGIFSSIGFAAFLSVAGSLRTMEQGRTHEAEKALARQVADQKALLDNLDEMVWTMDQDGTILARNRKAAHNFKGAFGYTIEPGQNWLEVVPDAVRKRTRESFERAMAGGSFTVERAFTIWGDPREVVVSYKPVRNDEDHVVGVTASARDVTDEKEAQRLREASIRQETEIGELRQQEATRKELLSTASHELATPLTPIKLQLAVFRRKHGDTLTEDQVQSLDILERSTDRLASLAGDILDVARLESHRMKLRFTEFDLCSLLESEMRLMQPFADGRVITLVRDCPSEPVRVKADEGRMGQVVANLLSNAIKFSSQGGTITLRCRAIDGTTGESTEGTTDGSPDDGDGPTGDPGPTMGGQVEVSVTDDGRGITADGLERLFQPFSQVHDPDLAVGGTGLGLFICKGVVEGHGGRIEARSDGPGKGATFTVRIPRSPGPSDPGPTP